MEVPEFKTFFPEQVLMNAEQKLFYKLVRASFRKGEYIELDGNISYAIKYIYKLLNKYSEKDFENLFDFLMLLSEMYKHEGRLTTYCESWAHDCLLVMNKYDEYLDKTEPKAISRAGAYSSNLRLNIQEKIELPANPMDILLMAGGRETRFILENQDLYKDKVSICFNAFAEKNGGWFNLLNSWLQDPTLYQHTLFDHAFMKKSYKLSFNLKVFYATREHFYATREHFKVIKALSRDAENLARESVGIPKVGEGWVSETRLYRKLESEFSNTEVIQHGNPAWLGRQHFDIWMPNWKIAVEHHGKQHFEPVDFFGGEESFTETVERDKRKVELAEKHGVILLTVTENDDVDELIKKIYRIQNKRRVSLP